MGNKQRIATEQYNVALYLRACRKAGFVPKYMNTGDDTKPYDAADLFEADECFVIFEGGAWLRFIYGNEPEEVLSDYTVNLEDAVKPINDKLWG